MIDQYEFMVAQDFLPAVINDDWTGFDDTEVSQLEVFLGAYEADLDAKYDVVWSHWTDDPEAEPTFCRCDVTGLASMCVPIFLVFKARAVA